MYWRPFFRRAPPRASTSELSRLLEASRPVSSFAFSNIVAIAARQKERRNQNTAQTMTAGTTRIGTMVVAKVVINVTATLVVIPERK